MNADEHRWIAGAARDDRPQTTMKSVFICICLWFRFSCGQEAVLALVGAVYLVAVCVLPDMVYRWLYLPQLISGFSFFLLAWVMVRILDWIRSALKSPPERG